MRSCVLSGDAVCPPKSLAPHLPCRLEASLVFHQAFELGITTFVIIVVCNPNKANMESKGSISCWDIGRRSRFVIAGGTPLVIATQLERSSRKSFSLISSGMVPSFYSFLWSPCTRTIPAGQDAAVSVLHLPIEFEQLFWKPLSQILASTTATLLLDPMNPIAEAT